MITVGQLPAVVLLIRFIVAPLHASLAVGAEKFGVAVHCIVAFAPAVPIVGACVSICVIV